jgi:hypothetical protein
MAKYLWGAIVIYTIICIAGYFYISRTIEAKNISISSKELVITDLKEDVKTLKERVAFLENLTKVQDAEYARIIAEYEAYKTRVANIKPRVIKSIETIIQEVPAELVVVEANEVSNETIRNINASADSFSGVHND